MSAMYGKREEQMRDTAEKYRELVVEVEKERERSANDREKHENSLRSVEETKRKEEAATTMVRSMKAELVRAERRAKDTEEEIRQGTSARRRQQARLEEVESLLDDRNRESASLRKKAKQAQTILQQLGSFTNSP